jgi:hypothetical protein
MIILSYNPITFYDRFFPLSTIILHFYFTFLRASGFAAEGGFRAPARHRPRGGSRQKKTTGPADGRVHFVQEARYFREASGQKP